MTFTLIGVGQVIDRGRTVQIVIVHVVQGFGTIRLCRFGAATTPTPLARSSLLIALAAPRTRRSLRLASRGLGDWLFGAHVLNIKIEIVELAALGRTCTCSFTAFHRRSRIAAAASAAATAAAAWTPLLVIARLVAMQRRRFIGFRQLVVELHVVDLLNLVQ